MEDYDSGCGKGNIEDVYLKANGNYDELSYVGFDLFSFINKSCTYFNTEITTGCFMSDIVFISKMGM